MTQFADRWLQNWRRMHQDHRQIARGLVLVSAFVFIAKLVAAAKEMVVAWRYGISPVVDGYLFVFNVLQLPISILSTVLTVVLIPLAGQARAEDPGALKRFRAELLGAVIVIGLLLYPVSALLIHWFATNGSLRLNEATRDAILGINPWLSLLLPIGLLISLWSSWIMAGGGHSNTFLEGVPALVILAVLLAVPGTTGTSLLWGTLGGFLAEAAFLAVPLLKGNSLEAPRLSFGSPYWAPLRAGLLTVLITQLLLSVSTVLDQFFASDLGDGAIATLGYANRIIALLLGIGATAVSRATLPVFSGQANASEGHRRQVVQKWVLAMLAIGFAMAIAVWLLAPWIVRLLFERGAFTSRNTIAVTAVLVWSLPMVPWYMASLVIVADVNSRRRYKTFLGLNAINLLAKVILLLILVPPFGLTGIPLASAGMYFVSFIGLVIAHRRMAPPPPLSPSP
jgi:putative peptidoglycan lipid II flippase